VLTAFFLYNADLFLKECFDFGGTVMKSTLVAMLLMGALAFAQTKDKAAKADHWAGTWKFDAAKSKLHDPAPKEETLVSEATGADGNIVKYNISGTAANGTSFNEAYDGKADGQPYPFVLNGQEVAKIRYHRDSDDRYSSQAAGADGSTTASTVTLAKDGKSFTVQEHVKSSQGEFDQTIVYNKQ
jgi:hypothetical protein